MSLKAPRHEKNPKNTVGRTHIWTQHQHEDKDHHILSPFTVKNTVGYAHYTAHKVQSVWLQAGNHMTVSQNHFCAPLEWREEREGGCATICKTEDEKTFGCSCPPLRCGTAHLTMQAWGRRRASLRNKRSGWHHRVHPAASEGGRRGSGKQQSPASRNRMSSEIHAI